MTLEQNKNIATATLSVTVVSTEKMKLLALSMTIALDMALLAIVLMSLEKLLLSETLPLSVRMVMVSTFALVTQLQ